MLRCVVPLTIVIALVATPAAAGEFRLAEPEWDDLVIGNTRYRMLPNER